MFGLTKESRKRRAFRKMLKQNAAPLLGGQEAETTSGASGATALMDTSASKLAPAKPKVVVNKTGRDAAMSDGTPIISNSTLDGYSLDFMPAGVVIKRINGRGTLNKWCVHLYFSRTMYRAPELSAALEAFFLNNTEYLNKYLDTVRNS